MASEKPLIRSATSPQGKVAAVVAPNARQTFTPSVVNAPGQSGRYGAAVTAILAPNARQTHTQR